MDGARGELSIGFDADSARVYRGAGRELPLRVELHVGSRQRAHVDRVDVATMFADSIGLRVARVSSIGSRNGRRIEA